LGGRTGASGSDSFKTGEAGDAVCAFSFEGVGGAEGGGGGVVRMAAVGMGMALVAVFDGGGG